VANAQMVSTKGITVTKPIDHPHMLDHLHDYFSHTPDIRALVDAIRDKKYGLGLIWNSTDFDGIRERLSGYPDTWVISQTATKLFEWIDKQEVSND